VFVSGERRRKFGVKKKGKNLEEEQHRVQSSKGREGGRHKEHCLCCSIT